MEEEDEGNPITQEIITQVIKKHNLYLTPSLNEVLYLQHRGVTKIQNLNQFVNLKTLWLNNNAISKIEGLDELHNLINLNLSDNLIDKITGLENLSSLNSLALTNNYISKIEGLHGCKSLTSLQLDHNKLKDPKSLFGLLEVPTLEILNLNKNMIEGDEFLDLIKNLSKLKVLRMLGNNITRTMKDYRRQIISSLPELNYLDDSPIDTSERRISNAWKSGGIEEERKVRDQIKKENQDFHNKIIKEYDELIIQGKIERGEPVDDSDTSPEKDIEISPDNNEKEVDNDNTPNTKPDEIFKTEPEEILRKEIDDDLD
ncbi:axoneme assembly [Tritrichomonas musculus]|uniref:Axoneme assembly n=1 Tax=Tritrichomonas musculus TaxID=1915356 RepID=A0ABR2JXF3_9EUKA